MYTTYKKLHCDMRTCSAFQKINVIQFHALWLIFESSVGTIEVWVWRIEWNSNQNVENFEFCYSSKLQKMLFYKYIILIPTCIWISNFGLHWPKKRVKYHVKGVYGDIPCHDPEKWSINCLIIFVRQLLSTFDLASLTVLKQIYPNF